MKAIRSEALGFTRRCDAGELKEVLGLESDAEGVGSFTGFNFVRCFDLQFN